MGVNPIAQRILAQGTKAENTTINEETRKSVQEFQMKCSNLPIWERESALASLIEKVAYGKEDMEILRGVLSSGKWLLELEGVSRRIRWIKTLPKPVNFSELKGY